MKKAPHRSAGQVRQLAENQQGEAVPTPYHAIRQMRSPIMLFSILT